MDLIKDWYDEIIKQMKELELQFDELKRPRILAIEYINFCRKRDLGKMWKVCKSKEFYCPPQYRGALKNIEYILENGGDIYPYLSTSINKVSKQDGLFNDWGILHLHLGDKTHPTKKEFISRTGPLLFMYKDDGIAHFLCVFNHGNWTNKELLQIIENNWPEVLNKYRYPGATGVASNYSEKEHLELRKAGSLVFMELRDKHGNPIVIAPPFLGIATSGHAYIDVRQHDYEYERIKNMENIIRQNLDYIKEKILSVDREIPEKLLISFILGDDKPILREKIQV